MNNVIDIRTRMKVDENGRKECGLPVFSGDVHFEEIPMEIDFANFLVQVCYQLPERSRFYFLNGMDKMQDLCEYAINSGNAELVHKLCEMGFLNRGVSNESNR